MKNHLIILLIVALTISGVGNYLQYRSAELAQRARNIEAEEFAKKQLHDLGVIEFRGLQIQYLMNDRREDSVRHTKTQSGLKAKIAALKSRVTGPAVVQDTIIVFSDSLIYSLEQQRDTLYISDNQVIDSLQRSNLELSELFKGQFKQTIRAENELRREKTKRWSIGPSASYGFRGADVGISVQYSLLRF